MKLPLHRLLAVGSLLLAAVQEAQPPVELELGQPIEREIGSGAVALYRLEIPAGWFVHIRVDQLGADVAVSMLDSGGRVLVERDRPGTSTDPEPISIVASVTGRHVVSVKSTDAAGTTGRFRIALKVRREATEADRRFENAERRMEEGHRLYVPATLAQAIAPYEAALTIWHDLRESEWEAHTLMQLGWAQLYRGEVDAAVNRLNQAVSLWQSLHDASHEAVALNVIGITLLQRGNARDALEVETRAAALAARGQNLEAEASALSNLSAAHWKLGDRQAEMLYQQRAIDATRKLGSKSTLMTLLHNRGVTLTEFGEYESALVHLRESLELARGVKNRRSQAAALNSIAQVYYQLGLSREALTYHEQALALRRADQDRAGISQSLNNIALVHRALGNGSQAQAAFDEALLLAREMKNRAGEATVLQNLGALAYQVQKDSRSALTYLHQAWSIAEEIGNLGTQASIARHLGYALGLQGDEALAAEQLNRAIDLSRRVRDPVTEVDALHELALVAARRGALAEARSHLETALSQIESRRRLLLGDAFRTAFLSTAAGVNADYVEILMRLHDQQPAAGYAEQALKAVEGFRARSLLDSLQDARVDLSRDVSPADVERVRDLQRRIDMAARQEADLIAAKRTADLASVQANLNQLVVEHNELRGQINAASPRVATLVGAQPLPLNQLQSQILDGQTMLLEYSLGRDRSFLWVVTASGLRSFVLPPRDEIESLARRVHDLMIVRNDRNSNESAMAWRTRVDRADADLDGALTALGRILLEPVAPLLAGNRILVVASDALQYIPFSALRKPGQSAPLIVTNEVITLPSASALAAIRRERSGRSRATGTVAVIADPVFTLNDGRVATAKPLTGTLQKVPDDDMAALSLTRASGTGDLMRLRYSRDEAAAIMSVTRPAERFVALDFSASRETVTSPRLQNYRIVHLASHGFVNSEHPELSGLILSMVDESGRSIDGFLRLHQIYNLTLPVDLVVLSACQTALGAEIKGEGLMSLTRGFMYAGASTVAASLWKVDDQATAELMKLFYGALLSSRHSTPAEAMRAAQMSLMKQSRWRSPYYWAAFTLQGDWR